MMVRITGKFDFFTSMCELPWTIIIDSFTSIIVITTTTTSPPSTENHLLRKDPLTFHYRLTSKERTWRLIITHQESNRVWLLYSQKTLFRVSGQFFLGVCAPPEAGDWHKWLWRSLFIGKPGRLNQEIILTGIIFADVRETSGHGLLPNNVVFLISYVPYKITSLTWTLVLREETNKRP